MQYIYRITNKINNKMYIGRTNKPDYKWARHKYNSAITIALIKYGKRIWMDK